MTFINTRLILYNDLWNYQLENLKPVKETLYNRSEAQIIYLLEASEIFLCRCYEIME